MRPYVALSGHTHLAIKYFLFAPQGGLNNFLRPNGPVYTGPLGLYSLYFCWPEGPKSHSPGREAWVRKQTAEA